jgi:PAS domain S-box-containing protein
MRTKQRINGQTTARERARARSRKATNISDSTGLRIVAPAEKIRVLEAELSVLRRQLQTQLPGDVHPVPYVLLRTSGLITAANASAVRLFGRSHGDVVNQPLHQFVATSDRVALARHVRQCVLGVSIDGCVQTEVNIRTRNNWLPARLVTAVAAETGSNILHTAIIDMSDCRAAQQWLALEDKNFQHLLESIDGIAWEAEYPLKLLYVSAQVERVLGYPAETWMGTPRFWEDHIHVDDRERVLKERDAALRRGGSHVIEYRFHTARNGVAWLQDSVLVTRTSQGHTRIQGLMVNITPLKNAELELRHLNQQLRWQAEEHKRHLEQTIESMERFCYGIAHELRAPVRAMKGFGDIVLQELGSLANETVAHDLKRITAAAARMDRLIEDLLAYGRLHHADLLILPVRVNQTVGRVLETLAGEVEKYNAVVRVQPTSERVYAHPMLLLQALENLIANGLKFVQPGKTPEVAISTWRVDGNRLRIVVRDNGVGIDPAWHHKIFGVFQRAHSADEFPGTGIGLAMVKRIVDLLNGEVGVISVPGKGSTFWIELPVAPPIDL